MLLFRFRLQNYAFFRNYPSFFSFFCCLSLFRKIPSRFFGSLEDLQSENGDFANCFPGLRRWLDYPHIASIACPKPMLFINGSQDKLFPVAGVEKAFKIMHDTWASQGAPDKLETELWDMPHSCGKRSQARVLEFFQKYL